MVEKDPDYWLTLQGKGKRNVSIGISSDEYYSLLSDIVEAAFEPPEEDGGAGRR